MMQWLLVNFIVCISYSAFVQPKTLNWPADDGRIVGGEDGDIQDLPYQLSVHFYGSHSCGASIIGRYWAVSAAHCFQGDNNGVVLVAGTNNHMSGGQKHEIERIINHPSYNQANSMDNDIAVLKVRSPFNVGTPGVNCIRLASREIFTGAQTLVSGWGYLAEEVEQPANHLQRVMVPIVSRSECNMAYGGGITNNMICAGYQQGGKDACQGDSGGPLVAQNELIGVVSFGVGCARPGLPGVYTHVYRYRNWIESITGQLNC